MLAGLAGALLALAPLPSFTTVAELRLDRMSVSLVPVPAAGAVTTSEEPRADGDPEGGEPDLADVAVARDRAQSPVTAVDAFSTIGVSVPVEVARADQPVLVRVHGADGWEPWREAEVALDEAPDGPSPADGTISSAPIWVRAADAYQVNVPALLGDQADVLLVREAESSRRIEVEQEPAGAAGWSTPAIRSRSSWGARPGKEYEYADDVSLGIVHHSVSANAYRETEVPGILRGIQAYHMDANGWDDIAYNFAVDRFGRIWEARGGGLLAPVIGGHARGFNAGSTGVVMLGDFTSSAPTSAALSATAEILAWKLSVHGVDPAGTVAFTTKNGNELHDPGTTLLLPRIVGHRDTGSTGCPGNLLYSQLARIRSSVAARAGQLVAPTGALQSVDDVGGGLRLAGWALDIETAGPVRIDVYVDGVGRASQPANRANGSTASSHAPWGTDHGFAIKVLGLSPGPHEACAFAIGVGRGANALLGCRRVHVTAGSPTGVVESVTFQPNGLTVRGWAIDPDTVASIPIHVYVDGVGRANVLAGDPRPDVAERYPGFGEAHGFDGAVTGVAPGRHSVCAFAIESAGTGTNRLLDCRIVTVPDGSPFGVIDDVRVGAGSVSVRGWALDPDTRASIPVHVYVDGIGRAAVADVARPDLDASFPGVGEAHGFQVDVGGLDPGVHSVCTFAIESAGTGANRLLDCREVRVASGAPRGAVTASVGGPRSVVVRGWALDPDTTAPVAVHVYVDGVGRANVPAASATDQVPPDDGLFGDLHGFDVQIRELAPGPRVVCTFAIDAAGGGANTLLSCATVVVPSGSPLGAFVLASKVPGQVVVKGWTIDPDTADATAVHVYVDGVGRANVVANGIRPDVAAVFPGYGAARGAAVTIDGLAPGSRSVCVFAIDARQPGGNTLVRCEVVTVG